MNKSINIDLIIIPKLNKTLIKNNTNTILDIKIFFDGVWNSIMFSTQKVRNNCHRKITYQCY